MARRRRKVQLGGRQAVHVKRAAYLLKSFKTAVGRGLRDLQMGNCEGAFSELISATRLKGEYLGHMEGAYGEEEGFKRSAIDTITIHRLDVDVRERCVLGRKGKGPPRLRVVRGAY